MKLTTEQLEAMFTWLSARHYAELRAQRERTSTDSDSRHTLFLELLASLEEELYDRRHEKLTEPSPDTFVDELRKAATLGPPVPSQPRSWSFPPSFSPQPNHGSGCMCVLCRPHEVMCSK